MVGVDPVARRLVQDLVADLPDVELVELTGQDDPAVGEPGRVQHCRRTHRQVGQVTRVEPYSHRLVALRSQFLEHGDGIGDARFQRVDGVYQQQAVVGVDLGVGPERLELASGHRHEHLDHRVGLGAFWLETQVERGSGVGREVRPADERSPRRAVGPEAVCAAHAELQHGSAVGRLDHPRRLGGDEGSKIAVVQQRGLEDLGDG